MNGLFEVLVSLFGLYGFLVFVGRIAKEVYSKPKNEIYVFFGKENTLCGKWDVLVASDDEDRILEALSEKYGRIYILRGADRWTKKEPK